MISTELTNSDINLSSNFLQLISERVDYKNKVCVKPWGYEFLIFESTKIGTWFLKINKNVGTSTHTHFKKDTIMIIVSGKVRLNMVDSYSVYNEGSVIFIPKRKFHGLNSLTETAYIIEIEIFDDDVVFSDKNDLLRLIDNYKRDTTGYTKSVEIVTDNIIDTYSYFYLKEKLTHKINNTYIYYGNLETVLSEKYDVMCKEIFILYENNLRLNNKIMKCGSIFTRDELLDYKANLLTTDNDCNFLRLSFTNLFDNKIITTKDELLKLVSNFKINNKEITLTSGCFDILHVGHLKNLEEAKKLGDILIVMLSSDEQIKFLKGNSRPINTLKDRLDLFKIIPYVDYIIPYQENLCNCNEEVLDEYMRMISPHIWCKGGDYNFDDIKRLHPTLTNISLINLVSGVSTTNIIQTIISNESQQ